MSPEASAEASVDELLVRMEAIDKSFPGVQALQGASFELRPGEVHALVGENGAGKSTLMKILSGIYRRDAGTIVYKGREVDIPDPRAALDLGISMIHQELILAPHLTVAQNIFLGREPRGRTGFTVDDRHQIRQTEELIERLHLRLDPKAKVKDLKVAQQQMVSIAQALSVDASVLIMDEPTAALTSTEIGELFRIIRTLKADGVGIVHISHRLEELRQISDRVTVMRDGRHVRTVATADVSIDGIISMMVGRTIYEQAPQVSEDAEQDVVLEVRGLSRGRAVRDVSFSLRRGEILGVAGLVGAGRTEMARLIFGADRADSGEVIVHGRSVRLGGPADAVSHGIGYLSEDRKQHGLALGMDVETNVALASLRHFLKRLGRIDTKATRAVARQRVEELGIKTPSIAQKTRNLSGGTQQKVVIGKWLTARTEILIFDEPTRGIDVGAKSEIYHLLNELAADGHAIIMISSELPEILRMSHRILVMCEGRVTGELSAAEADQERIMTLATQRESVAQTMRDEGGA
jgi:ribose transport system ATP-binding protein